MLLVRLIETWNFNIQCNKTEVSGHRVTWIFMEVLTLELSLKECKSQVWVRSKETCFEQGFDQIRFELQMVSFDSKGKDKEGRQRD